MKNRINSVFSLVKNSRFGYLSLMIIISAILCFFSLSKKSLTLDEVSTLIISLKWQSLLRVIWTQEGNMWLYFFINHFWVKLGTSEFVLRSLPAIFGILTVPIFYALAKNGWGERIAKIATPLFIFNLCFIFFAQTARGYSLSLLLATIMQYFFLKFTRNTSSKKLLFAYLITTILAMYAYLLIGLIILINYMVMIFLQKPVQWKKIGILTAGLVISLLPLLLSPSFHGHQLDWLTKPSITELLLTFILLGGASISVTILSFLIIAFFLWKKKNTLFVKNGERFLIFWLILWAGFPILFSFGFSFIIKPIFQPQSFNTSLPAFIILVSLGLDTIKNYHNKIFKVLYGLIIALLLIRLVGWYSGDMSKQVIIPNNNPWDWKQAASYVEQNSKSGDSIIFYAYYIHNPFEYYFAQLPSDNKPVTLEISSGKYDIGGGAKIPEPNIKLLDNLSKNYKRVWLVLAYNDTSQLDRKNQWFEVEKELNKSFSVIKETKFNQIDIKLFKRSKSL